MDEFAKFGWESNNQLVATTNELLQWTTIIFKLQKYQYTLNDHILNLQHAIRD